MNDNRLIQIFLALAGILGTVISVLAAPPGLRLASGLAFALIAGVIALLILGKRIAKLRRAQQEFLDDDDLKPFRKWYLLRAANKSDIDWIAAQEAEVYSEGDAIPKDVLLEWFAANPYSFNIICDEQNTRVGHLTFLPIKPATLELLIDGKICEREIRGDSIYSPGERNSIKCLWVESIALVEIKNRHLRGRAILDVLGAAEEPIARLADPALLDRCFALSATRAGDNLIKRLGFQMDVARHARKDNHDLYSAAYVTIRKEATDYVAAHRK